MKSSQASTAVRRFVSRNKVTVVTAVLVAMVTSGTAAAATYLALAATNTASTTTTLRSGVNAAVLQITNTNSTGGTSARGIGITVPAGRAPIVVNSSAGKATNLNADKLDGIDSSGFVRKGTSGWHEVGSGPTEPPFSCPQPNICPFVNYGQGFNTVGFLRDELGFVHLKGLVQSPHWGFAWGCEAIHIFVLPAGYRPAAISIAPTLSNDQAARIDVFPTGEVAICQPGSWPIGAWFSLDGIVFKAAQ